MVRKNILAGVAALGLMTTSVVAQADAPVAAPISGESQLGGESSGGLIALFAVLAVVVVGAFALTDGGDAPISA